MDWLAFVIGWFFGAISGCCILGYWVAAKVRCNALTTDS
jgi:hypothetical protein